MGCDPGTAPGRVITRR